jgi:hypothetical protein
MCVHARLFGDAPRWRRQSSGQNQGESLMLQDLEKKIKNLHGRPLRSVVNGGFSMDLNFLKDSV